MTDGYVLDASVALRWYTPQIGHEHASDVRRDLLTGSLRLETPDICRWEVGNALRKLRLRHVLLSEQQVVDAITDLDILGVIVHSSSLEDVVAATALALRHTLSLFDAAYVSLSLRTGLPLLTADARLVRAVSGLISTELLRGIALTP